MAVQPDRGSHPRRESLADGHEPGDVGTSRDAGRPSEEHPGWVAVVKHEIKEVGLVTLYFLACFGVILTLKKLFLADYQIEFYALSVTAIRALVAANELAVLRKPRVQT